MNDRAVVDRRSTKHGDALVVHAARAPAMRVVHLLGHAALNGVATSLKALIDAQLKAGHQIMLVHPRKSWIATQSFAAQLTTFETSFSMAPREIRRVGYAVRDWGRNVLHAHGSGANKYAMVFRMFDGVPTVMTAHARRFQLPWMFAHGVVGLSAATIDYYEKRFLVSNRRIFNVPNMFDVTSLKPVTAASRAAARALLGLRPDSLVIGSVGAIEQRKRQGDMVRVLGRLVGAGIDARLLLIGRSPTDPEMRREFEDALRDPSVADRVHLAGHRTDALNLVPAIDVFLCASAVEEAPIAPLEAMALAVPVVSTRVGNMADLLPKDRVFEVGDVQGIASAAARLLRNPVMAAEAGRTDRETVEAKLAPSIVLPKIDAIYRQSIASAHDRGRRHIGNPGAGLRSTSAE